MQQSNPNARRQMPPVTYGYFQRSVVWAIGGALIAAVSAGATYWYAFAEPRQRKINNYYAKRGIKFDRIV